MCFFIHNSNQPDSELSRCCFRRTSDKLGRVVALLEDLKANAPELTLEIEKILCHTAQEV